MEAFSTLVKKRESEASLEYLNNEKTRKNHTKVLHIKHSTLVMQDYLKPNGCSIEESKFTFSVRSKMLDVRTNYRGNYGKGDTLCTVCVQDENTQQHLLVCDELSTPNGVVKEVPSYEELFGDDLEKRLTISRILRQNYKIRKDILK